MPLRASLRCVLAWGTKPSSHSVDALAERRSIPLIRVEDGFLYGLEPGSRRMSLVVDDLGIYYDASRPSRLETYLSQELSAAQMIRSHAIRAYGLSMGFLNTTMLWIGILLLILGFRSPFYY